MTLTHHLSAKPKRDEAATFVDQLRRLVLPLARPCGVAVAYLPVGSVTPTWLTAKAAEGEAQVVSLRSQGRSVGKVLLYGAEETAAAREAIAQLVRQTLRQAELEQREQSHLEQLSVCLESLEAVYNIHSQMGKARPTAELIEGLMKRALAIPPATRAVLWQVAEGRLEPVAQHPTESLPGRPAADGVIGRALASQRGIIVNGRQRVVEQAAEPELSFAAAVLVAPASTRHGLKTVLELWTDSSGEFDSNDMHLAQTLATHAALALENERLQASVLAGERLRADLETASRIQQMLLVGQVPGESQPLKSAALSLPSAQIDGDFYDFFEYPDGTLDVVIGDVMGKGIPAALVGAAAKSQFLRSLASLFAKAPYRRLALDELLTAVQRRLAPQLLALESFVTLCYGRFDVRAHRLELIDCGHTRTIHYRAAHGTVAFLQGENLPLGIATDEKFDPLVVPYADDDVFFFYSDGITEARNPAGDFFGEDRLAEVVRRHAGGEPEALIDAVRAAVTGFTGSDAFADDFTCVTVMASRPRDKLHNVPLYVEIHSDMNELARVRSFIRDVYHVRPGGPPSDDWVSQLELATSEVVTNFIRHAYLGRPGQPIRVRAGSGADGADLRLFHRGIPYAGGAAPPLDGPTEGGMGLYLIQQCVDQVDYQCPADGWNCVRLVKRW